MATMNYRENWEPGCWCIATIQLCECTDGMEGGVPVRYPAQWAYYVWEPRDLAIPHAVPSGWGVLLREPDADLAEIIGDATVYVLQEFEADWPTLLDILLECGTSPPWLDDVISNLRSQAARRRRERWWTLYGEDRPAFEAFIRQVLTTTHTHPKEV